MPCSGSNACWRCNCCRAASRNAGAWPVSCTTSWARAWPPCTPRPRWSGCWPHSPRTAPPRCNAQPRRLADGHLMQVALALPEGGARLPADHEVHAYRIAQEALTNAWRHGQARHATVRLTVGEGHWRLTVEDDGRGLTDPGTAPGHGLLGLRERVAALGGQWRWAAARPAGICLAVSVPWPDDEAKPAASGLPSAALEEAGS